MAARYFLGAPPGAGCWLLLPLLAGCSSPLVRASRDGQAEQVRALLPSEKKRCGEALRAAAANNREPAVKVLLDGGCDVNAKDKDGYSPLMMAAAKGHDDVVRLLLLRKANVDLVTWNEKTAAMIATENRHKETARLIENLDRALNPEVAAMVAASPPATSGFLDSVIDAAASGAAQSMIQGAMSGKVPDMNGIGQGALRGALNPSSAQGGQNILGAAAQGASMGALQSAVAGKNAWRGSAIGTANGLVDALSATPAQSGTALGSEFPGAPAPTTADLDQVHVLLHKLFRATRLKMNAGEDRNQAEAAAALIKIGAPAVPDLIRAASGEGVVDDLDSNLKGMDIRQIAIKVLGLIGLAAKDAIPTLTDALDNNELHDDAAEALARMGKIGKDLVAQDQKKREEQRQKALKQRVWDADNLITTIKDCVIAQGKTAVSAKAVQDQAERTLSAPPSDMINGYQAAAQDAANKCQQFASTLRYYMGQYGDEGYAYLWTRCDSQQGAQRCAAMRRWLRRQR